MSDTVSLILAILGALITWTGSVATLTYWLSAKFRNLEKLIYVEQNKLDEKYMALFREHSDRIIVLELRTTGVSGTPMKPKPARY